jgi:hypothetical protein
MRRERPHFARNPERTSRTAPCDHGSETHHITIPDQYSIGVLVLAADLGERVRIYDTRAETLSTRLV